MSYESESKKVGRHPCTLCALKLDYCTREYGNPGSGCQASGGEPCFNTRNTCQDPANYNPTLKEYLHAQHGIRLPYNLDAYPSLESVRFAPTKISPEGGLGTRASITITLRDFADSDRGIDKYVDQRSYDPYTQGTHFGKLKARNLYYLGRPVTVEDGYLAVPFSRSNFRKRNYILESIDGPDRNNKVTVKGKDILKMADGDRAKCPVASSGTLTVALTTSGTTLSFASNAEATAYKNTDAHVAIGKEIIKLGTVSGSTIINCLRAQGGTTAEEHKVGDKVQSCKTYTSTNVVDIIEDLLTNFAGIDASYIPSVDWTAEKAESLSNFNLTTIIPEPTGVDELITELTEQTLVVIWWDEVDQQIKLKLQTPWVEDSATLTDDDHFIEGSVRVKDRHDLRLTQVWVYYGCRNFMEDMKADNFDYLSIDIVPEAESAHQYGQPFIKEIFSRWYTAAESSEVAVTASRLLGRFGDTPKEVEFALDASHDDLISTGDVINVLTKQIQDIYGAPELTRLQIIETYPKEAGTTTEYTALVYQGTPGNDDIIISEDVVDYNLFDELSQPTDPVDVTVIVNPGVKVSGYPAFTTGNLHPDSIVRLINNGMIHGNPGAGGSGGIARVSYETEPPGSWFSIAGNGIAGGRGGDAIEATVTMFIDNTNGEIFGGGGGGGGGGGWAGNGSAVGGGGGGAGQGAYASTGGLGGEASTLLDPHNTAQLYPGQDGGASDPITGPGDGGDGGSPISHTTSGGDGGGWGQAGTAGETHPSWPPAANGVGGAGGGAGKAIDKNGNTINFIGGNNPSQVKGAVS